MNITPLFAVVSMFMSSYLYVKSCEKLDYAYKFYTEFPLASQIKTRHKPLIIFGYTCVAAASGVMFIYSLNNAFE